MQPTDAELECLPEDLEEAFVKLEGIADQIYKREYSSSNITAIMNRAKRNYIETVFAAADVYGIKEIVSFRFSVDTENMHNDYDRFKSAINICTMKIRLRKTRPNNKYSVSFDGSSKEKLRHLLSQMRAQIDNLDISVAKKERLFTKINALQDEIDRDRTRYRVLADLMIEVADDAGEAATRLEPVVRLMERVAATFGIAKRSEERQRLLPEPRELKRLEASKESRQLEVSENHEGSEQVEDNTAPS